MLALCALLLAFTHLDVQDADQQGHNGKAIQLKSVALRGREAAMTMDIELLSRAAECSTVLAGTRPSLCTPAIPCTLAPGAPHQVGQGVEEGKGPVEGGGLLVVQRSKHPGLQQRDR